MNGRRAGVTAEVFLYERGSRLERGATHLSFEKRAWQPRLPNNGLQSSDADLTMIRDRDSHSRILSSLLHCYVAPLRRTSENPLAARMAQISRPESTRSLPNLDLKPRHKQFGMPAPFDFCWVRGFKKQLYCLSQIVTRGFDRVALAGNIQLGAQGNVTSALTFNDRSDVSKLFHIGPNNQSYIAELILEL